MTEYIKSFNARQFFLSNFYPVWVPYQGEWYPSVENAFQAAKTLDKPFRKRFLDLSPNDAKRLGRTVPRRPDWDVWHRHNVMAYLLRCKFSRDGVNPDLVTMLLGTGDAILVEGNYWHDNTWGACYCGNCKEGMNLLGVELMKIRSEL